MGPGGTKGTGASAPDSYAPPVEPYEPSPLDEGKAFEGLNIKWKDGLPQDRAEDSVTESTLITSGLTSKLSSIMRLNDGDEEAARKELELIRQEQSQSMLGEIALGVGEAPPGVEDVEGSAAIVAKMKSEKERERKLEEQAAKPPPAPPKK
jgi:hypothetical protein